MHCPAPAVAAAAVVKSIVPNALGGTVPFSNLSPLLAYVAM